MPDNISGLFLLEKSVEKLMKYSTNDEFRLSFAKIKIIAPMIIPAAIVTAEITADLYVESTFTDDFDITALIFKTVLLYRLRRLLTANIPPIPAEIIKTVAVIAMFIPTENLLIISEVKITTKFIGNE